MREAAMTDEEIIRDLERQVQSLADQRDDLCAERARLREELAWYGEQARLCRLIHSEGDAGRAALDADGGKRARAALDHKI
jgi:hypothetical protein